MNKAKLPSRETQVRFLKFLSVGGLSALVQLGSLKIFLRFFGPDLAFSCSFVCSTSTHYLMNRFWALPSDRHDSWKQFREYLGTVVISYIINLLTFKLFHNFVGLSPLWSTFLAIPPSTVVVFLILNYRVFKKKISTSN